ncbi:MAG: SCO1664 family protein [Candidatus Promineifilaceae bacterium]|nr:SCO1664 family protein [Candidatus Promineifilaceae bacterium]
MPESQWSQPLTGLMNGWNKVEILDVLRSGTVEVEGLLPWSSNYTFLVRICADGVELPAVYKPKKGERPLWDFPRGTLSGREYAAFLVSDALGWDLVPPTVLRGAEHGLGSIQLFIEHDPNQHYFTFEGQPDFRRALQQLVLFDVVINNADRKGGHVIIEMLEQDRDESDIIEQNRLWGIDHGISFHHEYKLRTVIWEFAGKAIPRPLIADLAQLRSVVEHTDSDLHQELRLLLDREEIAAFNRRINRVIEGKIFPNPGPGRHYPWPPV